MKPVLIVVTGPPASGKTTLSQQIAGEFGFPILAKDSFKELLADELELSGLEWSERLGRASFAALYHVASILLSAGASVILEGPFDPDRSAAPLSRLTEQANVIQVICNTDQQILLNRYRSRGQSGGRHPIHEENAHLNQPEFMQRLGSPWRPVELPGTTLTIDTTTFDGMDLSTLFDQIRAAIDTTPGGRTSEDERTIS